MNNVKSILFVCTGNTCRSPMAEGIFNKLAEDSGFTARASSAGLMVTEDKVSGNSIAVCRENGIDISEHLPTRLTTELLQSANIILTMTESHKTMLSGFENVFTVAEFFGSNENVSDPYGGNIDDYRKTFAQLNALIGKYHED